MLQYNDQAQGVLGSLLSTPSLLSKVIESQGQDTELSSIRDRVQSGTSDEGWAMHPDGSLRYRGELWFSVNRFERGDPQGVPMLSFRSTSRWHEDIPGSSSPLLLERDEETRWGLCHQRPAGLLQPMEVAEWKWEHIKMDFVTHLPWISKRHDVVWVIVDRLTKLTHFLAVRMTFTLEEFYRRYIREIVRLYGVPVSIVSNQDPRFTAHF